MKPHVSQRIKIHQYLKSGKRITIWIAFTKFGCTRLSERVSIRELGRVLDIQKSWKKVGKKRVMEYYL